MAAAAALATAGGGKDATPPEETYFGFIPIQVGSATEFAKSRTQWLLFVLVLQGIMCLVRFVTYDFAGGFWMLLTICLGLFAWREDMNITYICLWGTLCFVNCVFDTLALIAPWFPFGIVDYTFGQTVWKLCIPLSYALGAGFALMLERDYRHEHPLADGSGAGASSPFGAWMPTPGGKAKKEKALKERPPTSKRSSAVPPPPELDAHSEPARDHHSERAHSEHGFGSHAGHHGPEFYMAEAQRRAAELLREQQKGLNYDEKVQKARETMMKAQAQQTQLAHSMYEAQVRGQQELDFYTSQGARPKSRGPGTGPPGSFQSQVMGYPVYGSMGGGGP